MSGELWCVRAGQVPYEEALAFQKRLEEARHAGEVPDLLLLLEHPPTYTKGRRSTPEELPMGEEWYRLQGITVTDTDRGGRVTYHGPGQLVGYPIVSIKPYGDDVHDYIRRMERVMIDSLGEHGVEAGLIAGLTGVWTRGAPPGENPGGPEARKIGSIGVHVNRGITTHGFAINVNNDLQPFEWIVPCGIEACRMTSLSRELGAEQAMGAFMDTVTERFGVTYERQPVTRDVRELAQRVSGIEPLIDTGQPAARVEGAGVGAAVR